MREACSGGQNMELVVTLNLLFTVGISFYFSFNSQKVVRRPQHCHFTFLISIGNLITF